MDLRPSARQSAPLAVPLLLVFAAACSEAPADAFHGVQVTDSAGVRIVETTVPGSIQALASELHVTAGWSVGGDPTVVLGAEPEAPGGELFMVRGAARFEDGGLAVANGGSREIFLYDEEGRHLRTVGGSGSGPGEFTNLGGIALLPGDTLLAWNVFPDRMNLFDREGTFVRAFSLPSPEDRTRPTLVTARLEDGTWVGHTQTSADLAPGPVSHPLRVFRAVDPADPPRLVAEEGRYHGRLATVDGVVLNLERPLSVGGVWAARGDRIAVGAGDGWEVKLFDAEGRLEAVFRLGHPLRAVTPEERRRARDQMASRFGGAAGEALSDELARVEVPDTLPAWDELRIDSAGRIWLRVYLPPWEGEAAASRPWWVFDVEGEGLGTVDLPGDLARVFTVESDGILALRRDELDVERVEFLPFVETR